jgi:His-Xaa-Ser system protein HxsD
VVTDMASIDNPTPPSPPSENPSSWHLRHGAVRTTIDLRMYRLLAVQKTMYRYANRCTGVLEEAVGESLAVTFLFAPQISEAAAREVLRQFFRDLLDQELREKIGDETRAIRSLILAQAFSKTDLIRRDE